LLTLLALLVAGIALAISPHRAEATTAGTDALCAQALALLNAERVAAGLPAIEETPAMIAVAAARAQEMAATGAFSHDSPSGADAYALLLNSGISFRKMGENIARSSESSTTVVSSVHTMLMASAPHRANMLDPTYGHVGIGIAQTGNTFYFAIVFTSDE
jgi:uncharacterized protein YkwD